MYCNYSRGSRPVCDAVDMPKHLDIFVGEGRNPECEFPDVRQGIHVHVDGLETYDQVKELIGFIHALANSSYVSAGGTK